MTDERTSNHGVRPTNGAIAGLCALGAALLLLVGEGVRASRLDLLAVAAGLVVTAWVAWKAIDRAVAESGGAWH